MACFTSQSTLTTLSEFLNQPMPTIEEEQDVPGAQSPTIKSILQGHRHPFKATKTYQTLLEDLFKGS